MRAEDLLPGDASHAELGGATVRKGTVGAFLASARVWLDPDSPAGARAEAERDLRSLAPALRGVGLFDVLAPRDARLAALVDAAAP